MAADGGVECVADGCRWKVRDHPLDIDKARSHTAFILYDLKPFTKYAVFVQTYTILSAKTGARSRILYFTTKPKSKYSFDLTCCLLLTWFVYCEWFMGERHYARLWLGRLP